MTAGLAAARAAEKAAPLAREHFKKAILAMTIQDAKGILSGGNTDPVQFATILTGAKG